MNEQDHQAPTKPPRPARPWRLMAWMVGLSVTAIALLWVFANFSLPVRDGQPLVPVSPETTWFTEPLDQNGDIDYRKLFLDRLPKPIPADENAFVYYLRALSPNPYLTETQALDLGLSHEDLKITPCPNYSWWTIKNFSDNNSLELFLTFATRQIEAATQEAWIPSKVPIADLYYQEQKDRLPGIILGSQVQHGYWPQETKCELLFEFIGPSSFYLRRNCLELLYLDSMRHLGMGEVSQAIDRLESALNLVRQFSETHDLRSYQTVASYHSVFERFRTIIRSEACTKAELKRIEILLQDFDTRCDWEKAFELQAIAAFQAIQFLGRDGHSAEYFKPRFYRMMTQSEIDEEEERIKKLTTRIMGLESVNWKQLMKSQILLMKHLENLGETGEFDATAEAIPLLFGDPGDTEESAESNWSWLQLRKHRTSQQFQVTRDLLLFPNPTSYWSLNADKRMTLIYCWLYSYRKEHGNFPTTLEELVPEFTQQIADPALGEITFRKVEEQLQLDFHTTDVAEPEKIRREQRLDRDDREFHSYHYQTPGYSSFIRTVPFSWKDFMSENPVDMEEMNQRRQENDKLNKSKTN